MWEEFNLSDLNGSNGFILIGIDDGDFSGGSVSSAGDINNDGIADLMIGAIGANRDAGEIYIVFGSTNAFSPNFELDTLDGTNGFTIDGINDDDVAGTAISSAGDFNNDGINDIIIGAPEANDSLLQNDGVGETYIVFGADTAFDASLELDDLDGDDGFRLDGVDRADLSGRAVSSIGDINNDGIDDVLIGAPTAATNEAGESYVVFGSDDNFDESFDLDDLDGDDGFIITGADRDDLSGSSVSGGGDINGDGITDLIIGAPGANDEAGETYVIFGSSSDFNDRLDLDDLDSDEGFVIRGIDDGDESGISVSNIGDFNGDNIDDLIIGAPEANEGTGETYIIFGSSDDFGSSLNLSSLDDTDGFIIQGIDDLDLSGSAVSGVGDINDDGFNDIIIGAPEANNSAGEAYADILHQYIYS